MHRRVHTSTGAAALRVHPRAGYGRRTRRHRLLAPPGARVLSQRGHGRRGRSQYGICRHGPDGLESAVRHLPYGVRQREWSSCASLRARMRGRSACHCISDRVSNAFGYAHQAIALWLSSRLALTLWLGGAGQYTYGESNYNTCPTGSAPIMSAADCLRAASSSKEAAMTAGIFNTTYMGTLSEFTYPAGCFYSPAGGVWFNTHFSGGPRNGALPLCDLQLCPRCLYELRCASATNFSSCAQQCTAVSTVAWSCLPVCLCRAGLQRSIAGLPYDGPADPFSASAVRGHDSSKNGTVFSA